MLDEPEPMTDPLPVTEPAPVEIAPVPIDPLVLTETLAPPVPTLVDPLPLPVAEPVRPAAEPEPVTPMLPPPVSDCAPAVKVVAATRLTPTRILDNHCRIF